MANSLRHIVFNRILLAGNLLVIVAFILFYVWLEYYADKKIGMISSESIVLNSLSSESFNAYSHHLYNKSNIFDIAREIWTIPVKEKKITAKKMKKSAILKENEIEGAMVLPMFSGVFVNGKFIRSGETFKNTEIQQVKNGMVIVKLSTDTDTKTYQLQKAVNNGIIFFKKISP